MRLALFMLSELAFDLGLWTCWVLLAVTSFFRWSMLPIARRLRARGLA